VTGRQIDLQANRARARQSGRGREAERPSDIPPRGWRDIAVRVFQQLGQDNVGLIAAGIALYSLLAVFPGIAAVISLYAMFASPADVVQHLDSLSAILPASAADVLTGELASLSSSAEGALGVGALGGVLLALWGARRAMAALMTGMNIVYDENETRSIVLKAIVSLGLTVYAIFGALLVVALGVVTPLALEIIPLGPVADSAVSLLRWVVLWAFAVLTLAVVYRYAPDRKEPRWGWVTWGSAIAATLWLVASALFTVYVANFGSYSETYGALGGVVVLLLWFWLSGVMTILGAEINAEIEHQTARDTTIGTREPLGRRGAYVADTVGVASGAEETCRSTAAPP
jgi:membrane protein